MAGYTLVKRIPTPFVTLSGRTNGPAVAAGRFRGKPGQPLWVEVEHELRGLVHAAGWPKPEQMEELRRMCEDAVTVAQEQKARLDVLEAENATLRLALQVVTPPEATYTTSGDGAAAEVTAAEPKPRERKAKRA